MLLWAVVVDEVVVTSQQAWPEFPLLEVANIAITLKRGKPHEMA